MEEMFFLGALTVLLIAGLLLIKVFTPKDHSRKSKPDLHNLHHDTFSRKPSHRPASHTLVHSHTAASRMDAADDIWRNHRHKATEAHWQTGTMTANRIFTDPELEQPDKREPVPEVGMTSIQYEPVSNPPLSAKSR